LRSSPEAEAIDARQMDGQTLTFPDASFDRVCSVFGIPLFTDWRAGLAEMARVMAPGGIAIVAVANNPVGFGPNVLIDAARRQLLPNKPFAHKVDGLQILCDPDRLKTAMEAAGFIDVAITAVDHGFDLGMAFADGGIRLRGHPMLADLGHEEAAAVLAGASAASADLAETGDGLLPSTALFAVGRLHAHRAH
jgi:SAM-dependent methyltransferase